MKAGNYIAALEHLESRLLLDGSVTASLSGGGLLKITGDNLGNDVEVTVVDGSLVVSGNSTAVNGAVDAAFDLADITSICVNLKGGDNVLAFDGGGANVRKAMFKSGGGDNNITVSNVGAARKFLIKTGNGENAITLDTLTSDKAIVVKSGRGADTVGVINSTAALTIILNTGIGADVVTLDGTDAENVSLLGQDAELVVVEDEGPGDDGGDEGGDGDGDDDGDPVELVSFSEDFSTNPILGGTAVIIGPDTSLDTWLESSTAFDFTTPGELVQNVCSNWRYSGFVTDTSDYINDAARLSFDLGGTFTEADSFEFGADIWIDSDGFYSTGWAPFTFGLTNSETTGNDRSTSMTTSGDTYDSIEFSYFPADSGGFPTASQVLFGSQDGAESSFDRFAWESGNLLPTGAGREYGLPTDIWLTVTVAYDGSTKVLSLTVKDLLDNHYVDQSTSPDMIFPDTWPDSHAATFAVDSFAITNYQDGWNIGGFMPSVLATVKYSNIWFTQK